MWHLERNASARLGTLSPSNRALDFATRNLIAETVRDTLQREIRDNARLFQQRNETPLQLHGPCSTVAEMLVLGTVLSGAALASELPLEPSDFWAMTHERIWRALLASESLQGPGPQHWRIAYQFDVLGLIAGQSEAITEECERMAVLARDFGAMRDVAAAVLVIKQHAQARRLVSLMVDLATGITNGSQSHESAKIALREHFVSERR